MGQASSAVAQACVLEAAQESRNHRYQNRRRPIPFRRSEAHAPREVLAVASRSTVRPGARARSRGGPGCAACRGGSSPAGGTPSAIRSGSGDTASPSRAAYRGRRFVAPVVHPAVPAGRDARGIGDAVVDDPAPGAVLVAVVAVALLVLAHGDALSPRPEARAEGLAVPPSEELEKEGFHRCRSIARDGVCKCRPERQKRRRPFPDAALIGAMVAPSFRRSSSAATSRSSSACSDRPPAREPRAAGEEEPRPRCARRAPRAGAQAPPRARACPPVPRA